MDSKFITHACLAVLLVGESPTLGQDAPAKDETGASFIAKQKQMFAGVDSGSSCYSLAGPDEIVVCGRGIDRRVRTLTPVETGGPRHVRLAAPPNGSVGASVTVTGCFLQKCPKKFVLIDLSAIPEASEGSDADLIARGIVRDR